MWDDYVASNAFGLPYVTILGYFYSVPKPNPWNDSSQYIFQPLNVTARYRDDKKTPY
jgi:hypothetical protein